MEYPKPEPRPKKRPVPIKRFSEKRAKLEREKIATYKAIKNERPPICRGCGTRFALSHSHRIGQRDLTQIANPLNLDYYCMDGNNCHALFERGFVFQLDNGQDVMQWLEETDHERFMSKLFKMSDRIRENQLKVEDLPEWVGEILKKIL